MLHTLSVSLLPALMIVAAVSDMISLRIPNWLTGLIALLFFPMAWFTGMPISDFGWHVLVGLALFFSGYVLFSFGLFGGGDAKLMAAAGLWFGTAQALPFLVMTVVAGGVLAIAMAIWSLLAMAVDIHGPLSGLGDAAKKVTPKIPYGFAFAIGAILVFPQTWWMGVA